MPHTHTRTFRIRNYECDAYTHLNSANYLRFMQETAFDASTAAGYDKQRYEQMQRYWLIRESGVDFLRPLHYNDCVAVKTWIADFRRVTSRRAYEFSLEGTKELAARAYTDWVYLDTVNNRPATIPDSLAADFYPEGIPQSFPSRLAFPKFPSPPEGVFKARHKVVWNDLDPMVHVNNATYLDYLSDCGMQTIASFGWPWQRMRDEGFGIFLRRLQIQYLQPALLDDELEIATWAAGARRTAAERFYTIHRVQGGALIAQAYTLGVWVSLTDGQPMRIPAKMLTDIAPNMV